MSRPATKNSKAKYVRKTQPADTRSMVRTEVNRVLKAKADYKHTTVIHNANTISASGTVYDLLASLSRGDNPVNQYNGSMIRAKSIRIRGVVSSVDAYNVFRIIIFQWFDAGVPTPAGLINSTTSANAPYGTTFWTNKYSKKVLRDDTILCDPTGMGVQQLLDYYVSASKIRQTYFPTATDIPAQKNGLFMLVVSDSTTINHPQLTFTSEIVYTDNE